MLKCSGKHTPFYQKVSDSKRCANLCSHQLLALFTITDFQTNIQDDFSICIHSLILQAICAYVHIFAIFTQKRNGNIHIAFAIYIFPPQNHCKCMHIDTNSLKSERAHTKQSTIRRKESKTYFILYRGKQRKFNIENFVRQQKFILSGVKSEFYSGFIRADFISSGKFQSVKKEFGSAAEFHRTKFTLFTPKTNFPIYHLIYC